LHQAKHSKGELNVSWI